MIGEIIKIKFLGEYTFLSENIKWKISDLFSEDLFISNQFSYSESFLEVKIINYLSSENKIFVEILSYNRKKCYFNRPQISKLKNLSTIKAVSVQSSDTMEILKMFGKNTEHNFTSIHRRKKYFDRVQLTETQNQSRDILESTNSDNKESENFEILETYQIPFKKLSFDSGFVSFTKRIERIHQEIKFQIKNQEIVEEYDAIKNYFSNVLKKKKIEVIIKVTVVDNIIKEASATSNDIEKINKDIIESVKFELIRKTKRSNKEVNKTVFTMEEYFETFSDIKFKTNTFFKNETEFFNDLVKISNTKHYHNLRFLSSKHAHTVMKLRFIYQPFSFVFLIEGKQNYNIVWETLDTKEATYIWQIKKNIDVLKEAIRKLDNVINEIKTNGKLEYIKHNENEVVRIYHDYSSFSDGFKKWKNELENILT